METWYEMGAVEAHFADLIWEHEPIKSGDLVKVAAEHLKWKKSTTYTVLKKLCDHGIFVNERGVVVSVLSRDHYYGEQGRQFVQEKFNGSLPLFLTAFVGREKLNEDEIAALRKLIAEQGGRKDDNNS